MSLSPVSPVQPIGRLLTDRVGSVESPRSIPPPLLRRPIAGTIPTLVKKAPGRSFSRRGWGGMSINILTLQRRVPPLNPLFLGNSGRTARIRGGCLGHPNRRSAVSPPNDALELVGEFQK